MRAAKDGKEAAWAVVFERYERMLLGHVRAMTSRDHLGIEPQDIVQATFGQAWQEIQRFQYEGEGSFRRWLVTLAIHRYRNARKSAAAHPSLQALSGVLENETCDKATAETEGQADRLSLYEAMGELAEDDREVLLMYSDEGLNLNEIAELLGCCHETAKKKLQEAMGKLRPKLSQGHGPPE